jgi:serine/threonine protein kinase
MTSYNYDIKLKYEFNNISEMIKKLDIVNSKYHIIKEIKISTRKGVFLVNDSEKNKYIMKVKLNDFVNKAEIETYQKLYKINHPNVIKIKDMCKSKKFFIVVYNYIEGFDMSNYNYYDLYTSDIVDIFKTLLTSVNYLHKQNIYHGDIKPNNILITQKDDKFIPIIIDFDLSSSGTQGSMIQLKNSSLSSSSFSVFSGLNKESSEINNESYETVKENKDIWNIALSFYSYFFYKDIQKPTNKINYELIENYDGIHQEFVKLLGFILNHSYEICPSVDKILESLK